MTVVNHFSFIGTPQDVEEFRLMCRTWECGKVREFSLVGVVPEGAVPDEDVRLRCWGCASDALILEPVKSTRTQYTICFSTLSDAPNKWQRAVGDRWPLAIVRMVSFQPDCRATKVYEGGTNVHRFTGGELLNIEDPDEEWEDA